MYKLYSMELAGKTLTVDIGRVCAQANGALYSNMERLPYYLRLLLPTQAERWR